MSKEIDLRLNTLMGEIVELLVEHKGDDDRYKMVTHISSSEDWAWAIEETNGLFGESELLIVVEDHYIFVARLLFDASLPLVGILTEGSCKLQFQWDPVKSTQKFVCYSIEVAK